MTTTPFDRLLGLVKDDRLRASTRGRTDILVASESDKGRVVNAPSFRRLLGKAQVFPLDTNAAVRTRLTHSIEVSQVGRYLTQKIIEGNGAKNRPYPELTALVNTVETACLLHDIGNPPFGHFGESAVQAWFGKRHVKLQDLMKFDGNPQGFRLVSFLGGFDRFGLNLSCSLLLTTIKYPWTYENIPKGKGKIGIFSMDYEAYKGACAKLGWEIGKKFPLLHLMEAADDISYSMSDLEDGIEKELITLNELRSEFGSERFESISIDPLIYFKTNVINQAVEYAAENFNKKLDQILEGENIDILDEGSEIGGLLKSVNAFAKNKIYSTEPAERVELAGKSVITGLLNHLQPLVDISEAEFGMLIENDHKKIRDNSLDYHARLFRRLPSSYVQKYQVADRSDEDLRRAHLIVDYISGMTDDYAVEMYQVLEGIRIR